jgi:hypothetical protein
MADVTSNETFDRVIRSLKANGEQFEQEKRSSRAWIYWNIVFRQPFSRLALSPDFSLIDSLYVPDPPNERGDGLMTCPPVGDTRITARPR